MQVGALLLLLALFPHYRSGVSGYSVFTKLIRIQDFYLSENCFIRKYMVFYKESFFGSLLKR